MFNGLRRNVTLGGGSMTGAARRARVLMLAIAPAAMLVAMPAMGASLTWDPGHAGTGSDGNGSWDLTSNNWSTGTSDTVWLNDGTASAVLGISAPGTVTIAVPNINALGVTFNQGYTVAAGTGDTLTIGTGGVTVAAGQTATISAPIAGTSGLLVNAGSGGVLNLSGVNTYTGATVINGSVVLAAGSNLGAANNTLTFGTSNTTTVGQLTISSNLTVGGITSATSGGSNTITLNNNATLTDTGAFWLSLSSFPSNFNTSMTVNTDGSNTTINLSPTNNANFLIGGHTNTSNSTANPDVGYLDVSNVTNFIYNTGSAGTGNFQVAQGTRSVGKFIGAVNNTITAATVDIGDSTGDTGNLNNGGTSTVALGGGTNTINAGRILVGIGKSGGTISFNGANGILNIAGQGGGSTTADILVGSANISNGNDTSTSSLLLAGHSVNIQAGTVTLGSLTGGGSASVINAVLTFDTGTISATNFIMANNNSGGGNAANGPVANVTVGGTAPNNTATGVLNVSNSFLLANNTNTGTTNTTGTFTLNGGTVNTSTDILRVGVGTTTLNLSGGKLNLNGHAIGSASAPITNVNIANGGIPFTLQSLGGTGVNGAGLTVNGSGTLVVTGNNTYSGGTIINTPLAVGSAMQSGNLPAGGAVVNNNSLTVVGSGTSTIGNLSGGGSITANAGTLLVGDASTNYGGPVTVAGGTFGGVGTIGSVTLSNGVLQAGANATDTSGVLNIGSVNVSGGSLGFNLGSGASSMVVSSINAIPALTFNIVGAVANGTVYTVLTDSSGPLPTASLSPVSVGRTTITPTESGSTITVSVSGTGPANLVYNNHSGNGQFDAQTSQNFNNGGSNDFFFQFDNVTFDDTNTGSHNVAIVGTVTPSSMTVTTASNYTFSGSGSIGGNGGLTVNGGTVVLANTGGNTYTGATTINSGTLQTAAAGSLPTGTNVMVGSGATLDLAGNSATVGALAGSGTVRNTSTTAGATLTYAGTGSAEFDGAFATTAGAQPLSVTIASGNLTLGGTSTYVGTTTIAGGGSLVVGNGTAGSLSSATAINNGGSLTFNSTAPTVTIPNNITGLGTLSQGGTNALVFTGNVSFGGLNIAGGSVQLGNGNATTISGAGAITNNGALIIDTASNTTIASAISGSGSVTQLGSGTVTLSTVGTYSGGLTVSNGTVRVSGSGGYTSAGSGDITVNTGGTLVGTGQDAFGYFGANGAPGTLNIHGGTVTDNAGAGYRITLPNIVLTGGTLTSSATASSTTGQYSFQGPQTTAFAVGPASVTTNAASTTATISANAVSVETPLTFNIAAGTTPSGVDLLITSAIINYNTTVAQPIAINGPGTVTFDNSNNTFTGALTINSGTLQLGASTDTANLATPLGAVASTVTNNSVITFASSQAVTVTNPITGSGSVVVSSGTAILNGANSYTGTTTLNGGTLAGTGSISGAVVGGSGAHAINPGATGANSVGTLTVGGLTTNSNTTLAFDLGTHTTGLAGDGTAPNGTSDLLAVTGNITLGGGKLAITSQATTGNISLGYYKVISYSGTLTGSTSNITLPAVANNIEYTLDSSRDPGFIDVHRGFIGDATDDGVVDLNDLNTVLNHLGVATTSWNNGNFDGAATIDLNDLNDVLNHLGTSVGSSAVVADAEALVAAGSTSAVPEPTSLAMLGLGGALLLRRRRRA